jgi:CRISPR/Cas system CMR-associated protein Cmr5 small subunit
MSLPSLVEYLGQLFEFIWSEMICGNKKVAEIFSLKMEQRPTMSILGVLRETTSLLLPKSESELAHFKRSLEDPFQEFETKFSNFWPNSNLTSTTTTHLSDYLTELAERFAEIRRREILERARELVLSDYHNTMIASGDALEGKFSVFTF